MTLHQQADQDELYVHIFNKKSPFTALHGLRIEPAKNFHIKAPRDDFPDHRLCQWHYEQCVLEAVRPRSN